jgi:5-formyltetrahydrofolate cyclo-ligase
MTIKEQKAEIRKALLEKRDAIEPGQKALWDAAIRERLERLIYERGAKVIHTYLPFGSEIDVYPLIQILLDKNYTIVCPKALAKRTLENHVLTSLAELEEGRFGTKHPASGIVYTGDIDLFIVPGIGYDDTFHRLGYGSGYYDTFFASHPGGYKAGICYPFQLGDFPVEAHDVPLDTVIC